MDSKSFEERSPLEYAKKEVKYCPLKKWTPGCHPSDYCCDGSACGWWDSAANACAVVVLANLAHYAKGITDET